MSTLNHLTIEELQRQARIGNEQATLELGKRVMDFSFCFGEARYCEHEYELQMLIFDLENEIPPECPHCGKYL